MDELNSLLEGMQGALSSQGFLQSLYGGGGSSAAAGASGGGSSVGGSGGSGSFAGVLAILAMLVLIGKYKWSIPQFLRPNSAIQLAIERPG
jgi:hypothetical protein